MKPTLHAFGSVLLAQLAGLAAMLPVIIVAKPLTGITPEAMGIAFLAMALAGGAVAWSLGRRRHQQSLGQLCGPSAALNHYGLGAVVATFGLTLLALVPSILAYRLNLPGFQHLPDASLFRGIGAWLAIAIAAPFCEELLFRGIILRRLLHHHRSRAAIAISATLFAIMHVYPIKFLHTLALGLLWGWLYTQTRSIWPGVAGHFFLNTVCTALPSIASPADMPIAVFLAIGLPLTHIGVQLLRRANRIDRSASYNTPTAPPLNPITVE